MDMETSRILEDISIEMDGIAGSLFMISNCEDDNYISTEIMSAGLHWLASQLWRVRKQIDDVIQAQHEKREHI